MKTVVNNKKAFWNISHGRRFAAMCAAIAAAVCAFADTDPYAGYVRLNGRDTGGNQSWLKNTRWSDGQPPSSGKNYYVPSGSLLWQTSSGNTSVDNRTWQGGQLVIGDGGLFHTEVSGAAANGPLVRDLVLLGGSECRVLCYAFLGFINNVTSAVTVASTPEKPAVISHHHIDSGNETRDWSIQARFTGTADSTLVLTRPYINYKDEVVDTTGWWCLFSMYQFAEYPGTVIMRGGNFRTHPSEDYFSFVMPQATLRIEQGATCRFYRRVTRLAADAQIGALDCEGAALQFNCVWSGGNMVVNPLLNVSNRLSIDDTTTISVPSNVTAYLVGVSPDNPYGITAKFAHLTGTAATTLGDLSGKVAAAYSEQYGYPLSLHPIDNGDGSKDIFIATPNTVVMTNANGSGSSVLGAFDAGRGGDWTNLQEPDADSSLTYLNLKALTFHTANYEYTNATLSVAAAMYNVGAAQCTFKTLNLCKGGSFRSWSTENKDRTFTAERINLFAKSFTIDTSTSVKMTLDGDLYGEGDRELKIGNYDNAYSWVTLSHINTNFHGRIVVRCVTKSGEELIKSRFSTYVTDGRNLGGTYTGDGDGYDAITFKDFPIMEITNNVAFAEPTRGILVQNGATFNVASGKTLTLSNRVTFAGMLTKTSSGILDLAGAVRFLDGGEDTAPLATTNVLLVSKGRLRISSKAAADGLEVHFAQGTRLIIPADTEAGYFNVKWDEPLVIETTDGKLPVAIDPAGVQRDRMLTVPICTFNATAAANISPEVFNVTMAVDGMRLRSVDAVQNGDGTVSYRATFGPVGCRIILR